ncbi:MAG: alpha/beta fold hydrolase, partial [Candidatus Hydrogenedentota bacterium]
MGQRRAVATGAFFLLLVTPFAIAEGPKSDFFTASDGVKIHYLTLGDQGSWVVLIHGYTDTAQRMWFGTGIAEALAKDHRVVALDNRNHGESDKPEPNGSGRAEDVIELMDLLHIDKAHIHGYSMGGGITGRLLASHPEKFITAAFGGSGIGETDETVRTQVATLDPEMPEPQGAEAAAFQRLRERAAARRTAGGEGASASAAASSFRAPLEIDLKSVTKTYHDGQRVLPILRGVDLRVEPGKILVISGQSGAGKSTLLHILGTLDRADEGAIYFRGEDLV